MADSLKALKKEQDRRRKINAAEKSKIERHFRSQRELPTGRDFRWNSERNFEAETKYRENFDRIFPNAPGAGF